jgi:hypothetical protein
MHLSRRGALARRLLACPLQQAFIRQALPGSDDGGAMTAACLRLAQVSIVVARWFKYLFIFFITFRAVCTAIDDYYWIGRNFAKNMFW